MRDSQDWDQHILYGQHLQLTSTWAKWARTPGWQDCTSAKLGCTAVTKGYTAARQGCMLRQPMGTSGYRRAKRESIPATHGFQHRHPVLDRLPRRRTRARQASSLAKRERRTVMQARIAGWRESTAGSSENRQGSWLRIRHCAGPTAMPIRLRPGRVKWASTSAT